MVNPPFGVEEPVRNSVIGGIVGGAFMMSRRIIGISMVNPAVPFAGFLATTIGQWLVVGLLAPISEELFFRCILLSLLVVMGMNFWAANLIQAGAFSLYHTIAYASEISLAAYITMGGAFLAAFAAGLLFGWLAKRFGLAASIAAHAVINTVILAVPFVFVG